MYLLATLLLLVPAAGAVLVRIRTRETSLLLVLTSGAVAGTCIFWLSLWTLLRVMPGVWATLLSVAIVVALAALARHHARTEMPALEYPTPGESVMAGLLFIVVFASILFSSTALLEFSETMVSHVPLVASMERGNVPPVDLQEPPHPMYYHYGQHALAAALDSFDILPTHLALFLTNAWFGALAVLYGYALARRCGGIAGGLTAGLLLAGAGTLNWLSASNFVADGQPFSALMNPIGYPFSTGNMSLGAFVWRVHGNSMAWAMCVALSVCDLADRAMQSRRWEFALAAGVALSVLAPANETLFCALVAGIAAVPLYYWIRGRRFEFRTGAMAAVTVLLGAGLIVFTGGVMRAFFLEGSATHGARLVLDWSGFGSVASWDFRGFFPLGEDKRVPILSARFLEDVGPLPFLLVPSLVWSCWRKQGVVVILAVAALAALLASSIFTLTRYPENMFRLLNLSVVLSSLPVGLALASWCSALRPRAARMVGGAVLVAFVALNVANWPLIHLGIVRNYPQSLVPTTAVTYDLPAIAYLRANSRFDEAVLSIPYDSWAVLGAGQFAPTGSVVGGRSEYAERSRKAIETVDLDAMRALHIRFLYVQRSGASEQQKQRVDDLHRQGQLPRVWLAADRFTAIFAIPSQ